PVMAEVVHPHVNRREPQDSGSIQLSDCYPDAFGSQGNIQGAGIGELQGGGQVDGQRLIEGSRGSLSKGHRRRGIGNLQGVRGASRFLSAGEVWRRHGKNKCQAARQNHRRPPVTSCVAHAFSSEIAHCTLLDGVLSTCMGSSLGRTAETLLSLSAARSFSY